MKNSKKDPLRKKLGNEILHMPVFMHTIEGNPVNEYVFPTGHMKDIDSHYLVYHGYCKPISRVFRKLPAPKK